MSGSHSLSIGADAVAAAPQIVLCAVADPREGQAESKASVLSGVTSAATGSSASRVLLAHSPAIDSQQSFSGPRSEGPS